MISSRDLALIVLIAVVNFVFLALVGQVPRVITGIPGIGYAFSIFYAFNSGYPFFQKKNRLVWLSIFGSLFYFGAGPYLDVLILSLFYPPTIIAPALTALSLMFPVIIVEAIAGGYIGYKIYKRVEKLT